MAIYRWQWLGGAGTVPGVPAIAAPDRVAVMDDGRVVHRGAMAELAEDELLQQKFLGLSLGAHQ